ncbi:MAG: DUF1552 domain-containing protein [Planctomycetota bacterium]|nr:DUF1552 domain-containing protein [Planctomycetota bacterium]
MAAPLSRRTLLRGAGATVIGLPLLEEMMLRTATAATADQVPVRAFNVFFGLGIPAPLQVEGFDGVLEPLKPLRAKLLIMRNVDQVRCDESGINAHFDGASGAFTATPPVGEAKAGGASIDQVIRKTHHPDGLPPGIVPTLIGGTYFFVAAESADTFTATTTMEPSQQRSKSGRVICLIASSDRSKLETKVTLAVAD